VRHTVAVLAAMLLVATLTGCHPRGSDQRQVYCTVMADPPTWDNRDHPTHVVGQVRYWCEAPGPDRLAITLRLQKVNSKGTWVDLVKTSFTTSRSATLRTDELRYRTRQVTAACSTGDFRTVVDGSSRSHGLTRTYHMALESTDPCFSLLS
jgi:hypothetical protein